MSESIDVLHSFIEFQTIVHFLFPLGKKINCSTGRLIWSCGFGFWSFIITEDFFSQRLTSAFVGFVHGLSVLIGSAESSLSLIRKFKAVNSIIFYLSKSPF